MREIHKSRYTQSIPGINRTDDGIQFSHGEKTIPHFGDGLGHPQSLIAEATDGHARGRHTKAWCENLNAAAESCIGEGFRRRECKVKQWKEHLNREVDELAKEIERVEEGQREVQRNRQYFSDLVRVSDMTSNFRRSIPDKESPNDEIDNLQKEEMNAVSKADNDMQQCLRDLKDCQRKMEGTRVALMSDVEAKAFTLNMGKRCQNSAPLLSFPYRPADHPVDQIYHPNTEEDWENDLEAKLQNSVFSRQEASDRRCRTAATVKENLSKTADAWFRTSKAIQEAVQKDERTLYNIQNTLQTIGENISSTKQRIASLCDDLHVQDRGKTLQLWRLQTLTYRPGADHIRDAPVKRLEEELERIERKGSFVSEGAKRNRVLLEKLQEEKIRQALLLENVSKKLFIERENCLGLRRTVAVQGVDLGNYVTSL